MEQRDADPGAPAAVARSRMLGADHVVQAKWRSIPSRAIRLGPGIGKAEYLDLYPGQKGPAQLRDASPTRRRRGAHGR